MARVSPPPDRSYHFAGPLQWSHQDGLAIDLAAIQHHVIVRPTQIHNSSLSHAPSDAGIKWLGVHAP